MSVFLGLGLLVEVVLLVVLPALGIKGYRDRVYNLFALIEFLFYTWFFYQLHSKSWMKKIQLFFLAGFPLVWCLLVFDSDGLSRFHGSVIATGGFFIVCFALSYLYYLSDTAEYRPINRIPEFWIAIGLTVFYCCQTPYMGALTYLVRHYPTLSVSLLYLSMSINIFMYCLFGYAFICQKRSYL